MQLRLPVPPIDHDLLTRDLCARYPAHSDKDGASGVPLKGDVVVATGTDGDKGSGVYSVDLEGESSGSKVLDLLAGFRKEGLVERFWEHTEGEFRRIAGGVEAV